MARRPHPPDATEEGFLSRWSRRKLDADENESGSEPAPPVDEAPAAGVGEPAAAGPEEAAEVPQKTDADMPPVESINDESSVSDFFSPGVSETLRKAALRKLFHLPKYNIVDGLNDYDDDFRSFAALGDVVTADMRHRAEWEAEQARETAEAGVEEGTAESTAGEGAAAGGTEQGPGVETANGEGGDSDQHDEEKDTTGLAAAPADEKGDQET